MAAKHQVFTMFKPIIAQSCIVIWFKLVKPSFEQLQTQQRLDLVHVLEEMMVAERKRQGKVFALQSLDKVASDLTYPEHKKHTKKTRKQKRQQTHKRAHMQTHGQQYTHKSQEHKHEQRGGGTWKGAVVQAPQSVIDRQEMIAKLEKAHDRARRQETDRLGRWQCRTEDPSLFSLLQVDCDCASTCCCLLAAACCLLLAAAACCCLLLAACCLPACLFACLPACLLACLLLCLLGCLPAFQLACLPACPLSCA